MFGVRGAGEAGGGEVIVNPLQLARQLKGAPLSVMFVLTCVQARVSQEFLERHTGYTDKPVSQALEYLRDLGMVDQTRAGWRLTGAAQQLPMPMVAVEEGAGDAPEQGEESPLNPPLVRREEEGESEYFRLAERKIDREKDSLSIDSFFLSDVGKIPTLLDAAERLFGRRISGKAGEYADASRLLGWIAQAWDQRVENGGKIRHPERLVYYEMHQAGHEADAVYVERPCDYLPEWFGEEMGVTPAQDLPTPALPEGRGEEGEKPFHQVESGVWGMVCRQLEGEMRREVFRRYVAGLVVEDEGDGVMRIRAPDAFTASWCEGRLTRTVERMLLGMTGEVVTVEFTYPGPP